MRRSIPWSSAEEWKEVYYFLYSNDYTLQKVGINRVKAWASRGKLPHAVESTSTLFEVQLQDGLTSLSTLSDRELCQLYSICLIRFVNGFVDSGQKGSYAVSATQIAEQVGLPAWFIEIRHQSTHGKIPNLPYLRKCKNEALDWLKNRYWEIQMHSLEDAHKHVFSLVQEYLKADFADRSLRIKILNNLISTLSNDSYPDILIPILLDLFEKEFIPQDVDCNFMFSTCTTVWPDFKEVIISSLLEDVFSKDSGILLKWLTFFITEFVSKLKKEKVMELIVKCLQQENQTGYNTALSMRKVVEFSDQECATLSYLFDCLEKKISASLVVGGPLAKSVLFESDQIDQHIQEYQEKIKKVNQQSIGAIQKHDSFANTKSSGWALETDWQPCPIGCLPGSSLIPNLDLNPSFDDIGWLNTQGFLQIPLHTESVKVDEGNKQEIIKLF